MDDDNSTKSSDAVAKKDDKETTTVEISDPRRFFCDRAFVLFNKEQFILALQTGTVIEGQYVFTPHHAKRLLLRLEQRVKEYEDEHGELEVSLPTKK